MSRILFSLFLSIFIATGILVIIMDAQPNIQLSQNIVAYKPLIFGLHLAGWMISGMLANYFWDLFKANKTLAEVNLPDLLLPLLVSPIVFYSIWSMWYGEQKISFAFNLIAFQNGFFWQVVLSKASSISTNRSLTHPSSGTR